MKITETNCETGQTIEREMTPEEEVAYALIFAEQTAEEASRLAIAEAKATAKASAIAKFQALGLTEEEALALLG